MPELSEQTRYTDTHIKGGAKLVEINQCGITTFVFICIYHLTARWSIWWASARSDDKILDLKSNQQNYLKAANWLKYVIWCYVAVSRTHNKNPTSHVGWWAGDRSVARTATYSLELSQRETQLWGTDTTAVFTKTNKTALSELLILMLCLIYYCFNLHI